MVRRAKIDNKTNEVVNVIEAEEDWEEDGFTFITDIRVGKGDTWDGSKFTTPELDPPDLNDVRLNVLEDKARNDEVMTTAELREMYKLRFLT